MVLRRCRTLPLRPNWKTPRCFRSARPATRTGCPACAMGAKPCAHAASKAQPRVDGNLPKQVQNVIDFYGGTTSARALAQLPYRPSSGDVRPPTPRQAAKPFEGTVQGARPTISPYMNLFLEEGPEALPNYHSYVRPVFSAAAGKRQCTQAASHSATTGAASFLWAIRWADCGWIGPWHGARYAVLQHHQLLPGYTKAEVGREPTS